MELQLSVNAKGVVELTENFLPFSQIHVALTLFDQLLILILYPVISLVIGNIDIPVSLTVISMSKLA